MGWFGDASGGTLVGVRAPGVVSPRSATTRDRWRQIVDLAEHQGGAVHRDQLLRHGMTAAEVRSRVAAGVLVRRHRSVYAVGRPGLGPYGESWAAALAVGDRGALAGWSAAALLGAARWPARPALLVVGGPRGGLVGVHVQRTRRLSADDVCVDPRGLRLTSWPRTVTDLAASASIAELESVLDQLDRRNILDLDVLDDALREARGRDGLRKLRRALEPFTTIPAEDYRSLLERFSGVVLHGAGLGDHEVNGPVTLADGRTIHIDVLFRHVRLAVEVDGRDSHTRAAQFSIDRRRDRELQKLGYAVLRFTWQDVMYRPQVVVADIRAVLAARV